MTVFVPIALWGWLPLCLALFAALPPRTAIAIALVAGYQFLPNATFPLPGFPDYSKPLAMALGPFLGALMFGSREFGRLKLGRVDLAVLSMCLVAAMSSVANGRGVYDGASAFLNLAIAWGLPFTLGRAFFGSRKSIEELALWLLIGVSVYMPFCWLEMRISPQLNHMVYGFNQHSFLQHVRGDGYRPMVFVENGLALSLWLAQASVVAFAFWRGAGLRKLFGVPMNLWFFALAATTVMSRSLGATVLMIIGVALLDQIYRGNRLGIQGLRVLVLAPLAFLGLRLGLDYHFADFVTWLRGWLPERADSAAYRFDAERQYLDLCWERPLLGWSQWAFGARADTIGMNVDSRWIIMFSRYGLLGLLGVVAAYFVPQWSFVKRLGGSVGRSPQLAVPIGLAVVLAMSWFDSMLNAIDNPMVFALLGGMATLSGVGPSRRS